ncbi:hypothetical protein FQN54_002082 [Arachnomyces sp. PD_36]|nr:hypothetical protein FQN54_002082 [Arachnomyces sp. PD_36]
MTSTAVNSTPAANGSSGNSSNPPTQNSGARPSFRTNPSLKTADGGRRPSGGPADGGQRRNNPQKAWTQGTNPITQKPSYSQQNGGNQQQQKSTPASKAMASKETNTPDQHAHDRLLFLLTSFIGLSATITTKNGESFTGIFSGSVLEPSESSFMMKMTQKVSADQGRANGANEIYLGSAPDHSMVFDAKDIVDVSVANVSTSEVVAKEHSGASNGFRTDADISGRHATRERNLQRWEPSADTDVDLSLESAGTGTWDQFETNARLFGATSSYDENLYTTRIDRNDPSYKRKEAEAARIAREIESSETDNVHLKEERGHVCETDAGQDEEEKYSGVRRDEAQFPPLQSGQPNKYTPPARRAPTGQPTVPGAPVDPAIISAQIARPDASAKASQPKINVVPSQSTDSQEKQAQTTKAAPTGKPVVDSEQKLTPGKPSLTTTVSPKRTGNVENASANVETEVLDHFRQFANNEKLKYQERRRHQATQDRTIKLNELMKFSKNFKLGTPVPKDLVPILAKDPSKQEQIIEKAQRQHEEKRVSAPSSSAGPPSSAEQKPPARGPGAGRYDTVSNAPMPGPSDRQSFNRGRPGYPSAPGSHFNHGGRGQPQTIHPARAGPGMLSHRLAGIQQERKGGAGPAPAPLPIPDNRIPPTGPAGDHGSPQKGATQTPTSAVSTKFNVKALEFKPNPAASTFTPGGASVMSGSPKSAARTRSVSRAPSPSVFFGAKKPLPASERPSIENNFSPIKRMKKEAKEQTEKDYSFNDGIPPAYKTPPTWDVPAANENKKYSDMFKNSVAPPPISSQNRSASNPPIPHQHQLPFHLQQGQNMPPTSGPPHGPQHLHPPQQSQQHHGSGPPHFEDHHHRMQMSASSSQVFPSPRLQQSHVAYPSPMGHHAQLAYGGQPMPQFFAGQGGPQPNHGRHYPGGPQFVNPQNGMGAPMMVQNPSSGPYMGVPQGMAAPYNPQMQMYSPNPGHAYPQHTGPPPQPHSGYPSPSRGAPMMMHQGSQQGQPPQPVMFMNPPGQAGYGQQQPNHMRGGYPPQPPHFSSSPHQSHHYPPHQHRAASNNYNQMPQMPPPHMPPQPPAVAPAHPPESTDEAK